MKKSVSVMKSDIKALGLEIRESKKLLKEAQRSGDWTKSKGQGSLHSLRESSRYMFIAYAIIRGKTREHVEGAECKKEFKHQWADEIVCRYVKLDEEQTQVVGE